MLWLWPAPLAAFWGPVRTRVGVGARQAQPGRAPHPSIPPPRAEAQRQRKRRSSPPPASSSQGRSACCSGSPWGLGRGSGFRGPGDLRDPLGHEPSRVEPPPSPLPRALLLSVVLQPPATGRGTWGSAAAGRLARSLGRSGRSGAARSSQQLREAALLHLGAWSPGNAL